MLLKQRRGTFSITREMIEDSEEDVMKLMGQCIVVDVKCSCFENKIQYWALSPKFYVCTPKDPWFPYIVERVDGEYKWIR